MGLMHHVKTIETKCPACGTKIDAATHVDDIDATPSSGDITVCLYCGHICAYDDDQQLRNLTDEEAYDVAGDKELLAIVEMTAMWRKMKEMENENGKE